MIYRKHRVHKSSKLSSKIIFIWSLSPYIYIIAGKKTITFRAWNELCCITSLCLSNAPALTACLKQISIGYFSIINFCGRFGIKVSISISWNEKHCGADFKYSLFYMLSCLLCCCATKIRNQSCPSMNQICQW